MNNIQHIFFDLDHTLWDFDTNSEKAFEVIFQDLFPELNINAFLMHYIPINQACWKLYQVDKITHETLRYERLKQSFDALKLPVTDAQIDYISEAYIALLPEFNHLFEHTHETLGYLQQRYDLHIITNGFAEVQFKKMTRSHLSPYFKTITNSEQAGAKKPNPIIFEHALKVAKADKQQSIMVGDSIEADILGALDFGMQAVFFNPNQIPLEFDVVQITNLAELKKLF
ncbi:YjjG family noncanonical pyrimidine nucleotidase [Flavobacterium sp. CYK-55]|uniref:YjjG family noncanonical pyrimidine nucleotidase n=1 Tax=Flavobacterium sp. CYK-55 TaxID=2835529 RepID=UPI0020BF01D4|nr:YjjG family noncanonical pyrimidine nucleotidase [Flavobacterium sp. CYK-55]